MRIPKNSIKLSFPIVALSVLATMTMLLASAASGQGPWSWVTVKPPAENFSVRMPKQPSQEAVEMPNMPNLVGTAYSATGGRIYYMVKSIRAERGGSPQSRLNDFIAKFREALSQTGGRLTDERPVSLGGFVGKQYHISTPNARGLVRIYSTRQRIYVLEVAGGDEEDAPVGWFFESFTINEPLPPPPAPKPSPTWRPTIIDPIILQPTYEQCGCDPLGNPVPQASTTEVSTRDALICTKGDLELTDEAVKHQFNGDVILEVELLANGTVGGIKVIQSQPYGLEQKAVEAARQYKFCPALQDGRPVTQLLELTCRFSVTIKTIDVERPAPRTRRSRRRP